MQPVRRQIAENICSVRLICINQGILKLLKWRQRNLFNDFSQRKLGALRYIGPCISGSYAYHLYLNNLPIHICVEAAFGIYSIIKAIHGHWNTAIVFRACRLQHAWFNLLCRCPSDHNGMLGMFALIGLVVIGHHLHLTLLVKSLRWFSVYLSETIIVSFSVVLVKLKNASCHDRNCPGQDRPSPILHTPMLYMWEPCLIPFSSGLYTPISFFRLTNLRGF